MIEDYESGNRLQIKRSFVHCSSGKVVNVSTIERDDTLKIIDSGINAFGELVDGELLPEEDFETAVFEADEEGRVSNWTHIEMIGYPTIEEALIGHDDMCRKWENE